jgi:cell wall-associated NlpC family hydrolase
VSIDTTIARIQQLNTAFVPRPAMADKPATSGGASSASFANALQQATAGSGTLTGSTAVAAPTGGGAQGVVAAARGELGVTEQPPGSNDSPRIREYRAASGSPPPGPWCAYFTSWAARQAGMPLGDAGQGFGSVDALYSWAQGAGRTTESPKPGDLVVWDEHIGIVESVLPDGRLQTIEGNSSNMVARRTHARDGVVGFVRMS